MREEYGNLALKKAPVQRQKEPLNRIAAHSRNRRPTIEKIPAMAKPKTPPVDLTHERKRQIRHELTASRIASLVMILMTVLFVSGLFGLMVYRQSRILSENFSNLAISRQIERLNEESGQISERLAAFTDVEQIRIRAVQELGLQIPARSQIVTVVIPDSDRVVFNDRTRNNPESQDFLDSLLFDLEGFFKTIDVKGRD